MLHRLFLLLVTVSAVHNTSLADTVRITPSLHKLEFNHQGKAQVIMRNQDTSNTVTPDFALTSRPCPPFCIQPGTVIEGVETIGELELISYIRKIAEGDQSILVIDSRTPDWVARGTIPGATNIPWTAINSKRGATTAGIMHVMTKQFGAMLAKDTDEFVVDEAVAAGTPGNVFDYSKAKTLVMFCNGPWCGQSPSNIRDLVKKYNYPVEKIKWYRGGMQDWHILGLSTTKP